MARQLSGPARKTRLFLVDDEARVRRGLELLCSVRPDLEVCGEAAGEEEALAGILALRPDLAVVDLSLKQGDGLALMRRLRQQCQALKILVFTMHAQVQFAANAFAAGAHGYVIKEEGAERLLDAIHLVMHGKAYLSEQLAAQAPGLLARAARHGDGTSAS